MSKKTSSSALKNEELEFTAVPDSNSVSNSGFEAAVSSDPEPISLRSPVKPESSALPEDENIFKGVTEKHSPDDFSKWEDPLKIFEERGNRRKAEGDEQAKLKLAAFGLIILGVLVGMRWKSPSAFVKDPTTGLMVNSIGRTEQSCAVRINTVPSQAQIHFDGVLLTGVTPLRVAGACNTTHRLVIKKEGFQTLAMELEGNGPRDQMIALTAGSTPWSSYPKHAWLWLKNLWRLNVTARGEL